MAVLITVSTGWHSAVKSLPTVREVEKSDSRECLGRYENAVLGCAGSKVERQSACTKLAISSVLREVAAETGAPCCSNYGAARTPFNSGRGCSLGFPNIKNRSAENRQGTIGVVTVQAKGRKNQLPGRSAPATSMPSMPKFDEDDNPKFVIFIRTINVPRWYPLSIVSGGTTAKVMLSAMSNEWGKKLYGGTLTRNIASVIYKDEKSIKQGAFRTYPVLKSASGFRYGYKIVDKKNPRSALFSSDVIEIPPDGELVSFVDKLKDSFANLATGVRDTFGSIAPIEPEVESEPESNPVLKQSSGKKAK